jgi:hypothetical protein
MQVLFSPAYLNFDDILFICVHEHALNYNSW